MRWQADRAVRYLRMFCAPTFRRHFNVLRSVGARCHSPRSCNTGSWESGRWSHRGHLAEIGAAVADGRVVLRPGLSRTEARRAIAWGTCSYGLRETRVAQRYVRPTSNHDAAGAVAGSTIECESKRSEQRSRTGPRRAPPVPGLLSSPLRLLARNAAHLCGSKLLEAGAAHHILERDPGRL